MKKGKPNHNLKSCFDCKYCKAAVGWWCTNQTAIEHRNTQIPGTTHCDFWEPVQQKEELTWWQRFTGDYIYIKGNLAKEEVEI